MLRYFCPALTSPSTYKIVNMEVPPNSLKNLTQIAKVLQTISNGKKCTGDLEILNDFHQEIQNKLLEYFASLLHDQKGSEKEEGKEEFKDLFEKQVLDFSLLSFNSYNSFFSIFSKCSDSLSSFNGKQSLTIFFEK